MFLTFTQTSPSLKAWWTLGRSSAWLFFLPFSSSPEHENFFMFQICQNQVASRPRDEDLICYHYLSWPTADTKSKLFLFPHLGIRQHRRLNICKSTNIETAVSAAYWGWSLNFSPLPNNSWVKEPVGVFCSSAHHADNHFNLSLKRQKDGKWLCFTKQDKEQPKTCYLYSSILSVS